MRRLLITLALVLALTGCTPAQIRGWLDWHERDPDAANAYLATDEIQALVAAHRETAGPPPTDCAALQQYRIAAGLPERFDRLAWRESNCRAEPSVRTSCCVGPLQLYVSLFLRDHRMAPLLAACGVSSEYDVDGPQPDELRKHYCVAAALFDVEGFSPWS